MLVSRPDPERVNETAVSHIIYTAAGDEKYTLKVDDGWKLSTNASEILDIEFGTSAFGAGVFVLYIDHESKKRIIYQVTEPDDSSSDSDDDDPFLCDFYVDDGMFTSEYRGFRDSNANNRCHSHPYLH